MSFQDGFVEECKDSAQMTVAVSTTQPAAAAAAVAETTTTTSAWSSWRPRSKSDSVNRRPDKKSFMFGNVVFDKVRPTKKSF